VRVPIKPDGEVRSSSLPGGMVATTMHIGSYDQMEPGYEALSAWVKERGQELAGDAWEVYLSDPAAEPDPTKWRTEIVQPYS
jgi:effector-binding domain-containing protein